MRNRKAALLLITLLASTLLLLFVFLRIGRTTEVPENSAAYLHQLNGFADYKRFAGAPLDKAYANISTVKVVYDIARKKLFFINSHLYRLHFDFCREVLGYRLGLTLFNAENYGSAREYYLANVDFLENQGIFVLEFGQGDEIDSLQITEMFAEVSRSPLLKNRLQLLLNNTNTLRHFSGATTLPTCNADKLSEGLRYQAIMEGSCTGRLRICNNIRDQFLSISPADIVVVKGSPTGIPVCRAIISDQFQTPLSHIQVLSHNKKMPSAYLQNVLLHDSILKYNGQPVTLMVSEDTLIISRASSAVTGLKKRPLVQLPLSAKISRVVPLHECRELGNSEIGTKARGLADLQKISEDHPELFMVPEGAFVIPFYFYHEHLRRSSIEKLLEDLKNCDIYQTEKTEGLLARIRDSIRLTPLSAALLHSVEDQIRRTGHGGCYRFRSSSNAEDLRDFSGAGLYESKTGCIGVRKKTIEKAIKKVWASMYSYRAYQERKFANIDETTAAMGILVHRSFPDEDINGVVISRNIYRSDYPGIVINAQKGDVSTVNPPEGTRCEQLILTENRMMNPFSDRLTAKYLCYSSLQPGRPLLSYPQLLRLNESMKAIAGFYRDRHSARDIEFKFEGENLYIKQVRPYQ